MRFIVFLLGIPAIVLSGSVGWFYFEDSLSISIPHFAPDMVREYVMPLTSSPLGTPNGDTGVFVLLGAAFGLLGVLLAFGRCGWQGALLLIVPPLTTAIMNPNSLAFTGFQVFVGFLALFVFRLPIESPKEDTEKKPRRSDADLEDEWSDRSKTKAKANRERDEEEEDDDDPPAKAKPKAKSKRRDEDDD